jgi:hypothetical protein
VLSKQRDSDGHAVAQEAKCTLDTACHQGNLVSKEFVQTVLGFTETEFCSLTDNEKRGGTSATGHQLIPEGAIHLTWYHHNSTRVFRDMRFLVIGSSHYDIVIGARSIMKYNILGVPNLMVRSSSRMNT